MEGAGGESDQEIVHRASSPREWHQNVRSNAKGAHSEFSGEMAYRPPTHGRWPVEKPSRVRATSRTSRARLAVGATRRAKGFAESHLA